MFEEIEENKLRHYGLLYKYILCVSRSQRIVRHLWRREERMLRMGQYKWI